ncbi:hypothetical protein L3Y34_014260 [Caenorhabditis briggsae]|uniref:Lipid droplet-associated hydrolase n=1 Tax=Caenorhabditis briggsae TaxID=6238 RepID=A0AAE9DRA6_CAEBR|nr:hypothetical protein L3Y34_014260 [Caenorhabditis briggsae]
MTQILRKVEWVRVAGKWTKMSVMGADLSDEMLKIPANKENENRVVILMIPGNPGNEGFYAHFGREVLRNLLARDAETQRNEKNEYLFYTVSSLNHVRMPDHLNSDGEHRNHDRISLEEQVSHKLAFCKELLPRGKQLYVLGHSIGSYMMLRILPEVILEGFHVAKAVGLFPTIVNMATSPNGRRLQGTLATLNHHDWLTKSICWWVDYLPSFVKKFLVGLNLRHPNTPPEIVDAAVELVHLDVFRNIVHMSNDELDIVLDLDERLMEKQDMVHFYYGLKDGWCPVEHGYSMRERLGDGQVTLDEHDCEHAFVISEGDIMAKNVVKYFD